MTGLDMVAVAPKAEGAATPSPDRNPVAKGKNENDFARQLKKASSKHTVRQVSQGAGSQREVTTAEPKLLKNSGEQERAGPGAKEEILKSIVLESGETAPPQNQLEKERELCRVPYPLLPEGTEIKPKSVAIESEPVMERNENGASLQEQEVLVLADKLRGNEGSPGEPRLNPATAELSLETPESTPTKLEQEETRITSSGILEQQPGKAGQASQETTEEEPPRSERLSQGEQEPEAKRPGLKVETQPVRVEKPQAQVPLAVMERNESGTSLDGRLHHQNDIEHTAVIVRNENGASLQEQEVLVLADKLRANESPPGEPRLNPATAELSLETPESTSTKLEQEETRISPSRIFELQPEKANSQVFPDSIDIAPGIFQQQLEKAGQVRQASQETTEEELPRSERLSKGEQVQEAKRPGLKVETQPVRVEKPQAQVPLAVMEKNEIGASLDGRLRYQNDIEYTAMIVRNETVASLQEQEVLDLADKLRGNESLPGEPRLNPATPPELSPATPESTLTKLEQEEARISSSGIREQQLEKANIQVFPDSIDKAPGISQPQPEKAGQVRQASQETTEEEPPRSERLSWGKQEPEARNSAIKAEAQPVRVEKPQAQVAAAVMEKNETGASLDGRLRYQNDIEYTAMIVRNETGASLDGQEFLVSEGKLRADESLPGSEARLNPAKPELSPETPELNPAKPEQEETRSSPPRIFEQQLEKAGQVRQASQETTEEELPRSERLSRGRQEPEAQKPAMKVEAQPVRVEKPQLQQATTVITGKENDMPLLNKAAGEPLKAGYDPAALAVLLKAQGKGEKLSGKNKLDYEGNLLLEEETAGAKPNNKDGSIKGEVVSPRIPEAASKAQLDSDITEEFRLGEDDKNQPLKAGGREKEPAELPEYKESGKNMPGFKTEHTLLDNSLRNTGKPIQEKSWVDPEKFMEQVVKKAEVMIKQNLSQMRIQLHPEFLGKMTIKLVLEDGLLTARFITENQQVKNLLDSNLNHLRQNLENQGIRVEKTEVNVQLNNGGLFDGSEGSRQDLWEQPRSYSQYNPAGPGSDAYQASSAGDEVEAGLIDSGETYGLAADGSMNFLI